MAANIPHVRIGKRIANIAVQDSIDARVIATTNLSVDHALIQSW